MNRRVVECKLGLMAAIVFMLIASGCGGSGDLRLELVGGAKVSAQPFGEGQWGLVIENGGLMSFSQPNPIQLDFLDEVGTVETQAYSYETLDGTEAGFLGKANISGPGDSRLAVEDRWSVAEDVLILVRQVSVSGDAPGGVVSAVTLATEAPAPRSETDFFAPGMIYGSPENLTPSAIGGADTYTQGSGVVIVREDRLPAPMFGVRFADGSSLTVLNAEPMGDTTVADSHDLEVSTLVDRRFRFASVGVRPRDDRIELGMWFPGTEGEVTYRGRMYPGGQMRKWRRRYHPIEDGLVQDYQARFRFSTGEQFPEYYRNAWRWAWKTLRPQLQPQDIEQVRRNLVDTLASQTVTSPDGRMGIPNYLDVAWDKKRREARKSIMGFTGKSLEAAEFLLQDSWRDGNQERAARHRRIAEAIFESFTKMKVDPPEAEGFHLDSGAPALAIPRHKRIYLRSFGDDIKATLRAIKRERDEGRDHVDWLAWCRRFADWLLTQQQPEGGFPRAWLPATGEVADPSPASTYNAVPMLVLLSELVSEPVYLEAAIRAAEFSWASGQSNGRFVGGTIDNPDVIDKEAGTLSLEAYLALYEATEDRKWLERAVAAASFSETWIYCWNVPMPEDETDDRLHWKREVPTVGIQPISTGHSLTDEYMAFDADEFARLSRYVEDEHYLEVARILLHNTKVMLAAPGRTYDLPGPGWQQEHWSMAPQRGYGIHRGWLPWVSTSHLNGIVGIEEFDAELYRSLTHQ